MLQGEVSLAIRKMDRIEVRLRENVVRGFALTLTSTLRKQPHIRTVTRRVIWVAPLS
jgi:hypothetical protein